MLLANMYLSFYYCAEYVSIRLTFREFSCCYMVYTQVITNHVAECKFQLKFIEDTIHGVEPRNASVESIYEREREREREIRDRDRDERDRDRERERKKSK